MHNSYILQGFGGFVNARKRGLKRKRYDKVNTSMGVDEKGEPLDFLDVDRMGEEIRKDLKKHLPRARQIYRST